jgi:hypothetical protein
MYESTAIIYRDPENFLLLLDHNNADLRAGLCCVQGLLELVV